MVKENQNRGLTKKGFDYFIFVDKIQRENFNTAQWAGLNLRLNLLESFMRSRGRGKKKDKWLQALNQREEQNLKQAWNFESGGLTIVNLSCPFVDESAACALFAVCLQLFLDSRGDASRIVALDEAHKVWSRPKKKYGKVKHYINLSIVPYRVLWRRRFYGGAASGHSPTTTFGQSRRYRHTRANFVPEPARTLLCYDSSSIHESKLVQIHAESSCRLIGRVQHPRSRWCT